CHQRSQATVSATLAMTEPLELPRRQGHSRTLAQATTLAPGPGLYPCHSVGLGCALGQMAVDTDIDVGLLKSEIKKTYASVSTEPGKDFVFPTGRPWAEDLGYPEELANVPETAIQSFAGVANPFSLGRLEPGARVLDLGSGAGTDSLVAAQMVGS